MLASFLTTVFFSLSAVFAHRSALMLGGLKANFARLLLATFLLAVWAHSAGAGWSGRALPYFLWSGVVGFGLGDLALFQALPRLGSRLTVLLTQCLAAPLAALVEWWWLGTLLSLPQVLCSVAILLGVWLALTPLENLGRTGYRLSGVLFGVLAASGQALGAVISRKAYTVAHLAGQDIDGASAAYQRILGGLAVAGLSLWWLRRKTHRRNLPPAPFQEAVSAPPNWSHRSPWFWVVLNSLAGPVLGVSCYQWALQSTPTGVVLPIVATTPLVVIPFARVMEGERFTYRSLIGGAVAVAGAVALTLVH